MLDLVISGGQTGADIAGLKAAKANGIPTSGWLPKGCKTLDGPRYDYLQTYGMKEHSSASYTERTWDNVLWADGTVRFAYDFKSAGERCTLNAIKAYNKPYLDFPVVKDGPEGPYIHGEPYELVKWIRENNIKMLNVAGNSEQTFKRMEDTVLGFLMVVFWKYRRILK